MQTAGLALALLSGCYEARTFSNDAGGPGTDQPDRDAAAMDAGPDAGVPDGDGGERGPVTARHASCMRALPVQLPFSPGQFNEARDGGVDTCEGASELVTCSAQLPCPFDGLCVMPAFGGEGFCAKERACNAPSLSRGEALAYANGACVTCLEPASRKAACCGREDVDCRALPLRAGPRGEPGALCSLHEDCEDGLLCSAPADFRWGFAHGRCLCPGVAARDVSDRPDCAPRSQPGRWGAWPGDPLPAACVPGEEAGWVVERLGRHPSDMPVAAAARPDGGLHAVLQYDGVVSLHTYQQGQWSSEPVPGFALGRLVEMVVAENGDVHLAQEAPFRSQLPYAVRWQDAADDMHWSQELVGEGAGARLPSLHVGPAGAVQLAYFDQFSSLIHYHEREGDRFGVERTLSPSPPLNALEVLRLEDHTVLVYESGFAVMRADLIEGAFQTASILDGQRIHAVSTGDSLAILHEANGFEEITFTRVSGADVSSERVWIQDNARYRDEGSISDLALDAAGKPHVAHTAPEGILLQIRDAAAWSSTLIAKYANEPRVVVDAQGEPHVFFGDGGEARHAFRGSCP